MSSKFKEFFQRVKSYLRITQMSPIARRYFIKNGFDGSMTVLGIILGSWIIGVTQPEIIVTASLGACLAMGLSGLFGAYLTERAERKRHLKSLEAAMLTDLQNSILNEASDFVSLYAALVDGASPILTALISLTPFFFATIGALDIFYSYVLSFISALATLFALGLYLGKIAKENILLYGLQTLSAGVLIVVIAILFSAV